MRSRTTNGLMLELLVAVATNPASSRGDAVNGKVLFARCAVCHKVARAGGNGLGPNLFGVGGRRAGVVAGFNYSIAMKSSGIVWTEEKLASYIANPQGTVKGNRMSFAGLSNQT
jgi:cytochrome c